MKAIVIKKPGGSSQMKYEEIPIPEPGQNEVSVLRVHAHVHTLYHSFEFRLNLS